MKTRQLIQSTYFELLREKKLGKITVSEIARKANIDRKTFYLHYDSVEEILKSICRDKVEELMMLVQENPLEDNGNPLIELFEIMTEMVENNLEFFRFIAENPEYDHFFDQIKEILVTSVEQKYQQLFRLTVQELKFYSEFYVSGIIAVYIHWIREASPVSSRELAMLVSNATMYGIRSILVDSTLDSAEKTAAKKESGE
ncbi:MAG: TetR/AcrR family transcriptional regulator [Clostridiales bacterium]|nr:TetR/AcrR family transcriptional regulator [Clostridiales bacterium]